MKEGSTVLLQSDLLTVRLHPNAGAQGRGGRRAFVVEVATDAASNTLLETLPLLDRLLTEKIAAVRRRNMEVLVGFMAARMVQPGQADLEMAQRLAARYARVLNECGFFTAEQLADANGSRAGNRSTLADNWRKRNQVFTVPHPDKRGRERSVYPSFQFEDGKPIKAVQGVLEAFGGRKSPWKLTLWFTSNNGWLPDSARPVDLLVRDPRIVVEAAWRDAEGRSYMHAPPAASCDPAQQLGE